MADLARARDWSRTALGPMETWPELLVSIVNMVLATRHPMLLWWGPELIQFYNDAFRPSLGPDKHPAALGQPGRECWPEVWPVVGAEIEAVIEKGEASWHEDKLVPIYRNGRLEDVYWTYSYSPVRNAMGAVVGVLITCSETTDRTIAEHRLRISEERLRLAQSSAQLATWDWDIETGRVSWDPASAWVYGRSPESMSSIERCSETIHPKDREQTTRVLHQAIEDKSEYNHEFRVVWPDGSIHWLAGRGRAAYSNEGRPIRFLGINWDQTARKTAEEALEVERRRLSDLFQQAPAFVAVLRGPDHVFEMINPLYQELVGPRNIVGKPVKEALPEAESQGFVEILDRVFRTGEPFVARGYPVRVARRSPEPELRLLDFVYQPVLQADGNISGIIVFGVDVTARDRAEHALRENEKLAAVGRMASSIAHEINNPLEAVTNLLYLGAGMTESSDARKYLDMAQQELARVANIATQTLRFHRQSTEARLTSLREILDSVLILFGRKIANSDVVIEKQYRTDQNIMGFEGDLRQVFANLLSNALDAAPTGGRVVCRVRDSVDWRTGGPGVRVSVGDNGHGMDAETRRHIFEPFFTTKGNTGTGLGLWISREILDHHHAVVNIRSSTYPKKHGTVFSVWLPLGTERPRSSQ